MKTFFVLWIWAGVGNSQTMAIDHYATLAECEAAKEAIVNHYGKDSWSGSKLYDNAECLEAKVRE